MTDCHGHKLNPQSHLWPCYRDVCPTCGNKKLINSRITATYDRDVCPTCGNKKPRKPSSIIRLNRPGRAAGVRTAPAVGYLQVRAVGVRTVPAAGYLQVRAADSPTAPAAGYLRVRAVDFPTAPAFVTLGTALPRTAPALTDNVTA